MRKLQLFTIIFLVFKLSFVCAQTFAPQVGFEETTAIHKDSIVFVDWAKEIQVIRGYKIITNVNEGLVDFGTPENALNQADGNPNIVSLGDGGSAILQFNHPIVNGQGYDFAVFENGFLKEPNSALAFLELAFVEVSTDGVEYIRFPAISEIPTNNQLDSFGFMDARFIHNFAGKYINNYGTPFDLEDLIGLTENTTVDIDNINYIKIIDTIGTINPDFATFDAQNNIVNDPFPTAFSSGGFDLDAVGVIHNSENTSTEEWLSVYPNPVKDKIIIHSTNLEITSVYLFSVTGKLLLHTKNNTQIDISNFTSGVYLLQVVTNKKSTIYKILKE